MEAADGFFVEALQFLLKQGLLAVLVALLLWFLGREVLIPLRNDHAKFISMLLETNKLHADAITKLADVQQKQEKQLELIVEMLKELHSREISISHKSSR